MKKALILAVLFTAALTLASCAKPEDAEAIAATSALTDPTATLTESSTTPQSSETMTPPENQPVAETEPVRYPIPEGNQFYGRFSESDDAWMDANGNIWLGDTQFTFDKEGGAPQSSSGGNDVHVILEDSTSESYSQSVLELMNLEVGDFKLDGAWSGISFRYTKNGEPLSFDDFFNGVGIGFSVSVSTPQGNDTVINGEKRYVRAFITISDMRQLQSPGNRSMTIVYDNSPQFYMTPILVTSETVNGTTVRTAQDNGDTSEAFVGLTKQVLELLSDDVEGKVLSEIFADFDWPDAENMRIEFD